MFIALLSAVMQSDIPGNSLEVLEKHWHENPLWLTCQDVRSVACVQIHVGFCVNVHEWIQCLPVLGHCLCQSVCVCMHMCLCAPKVTCQDTDVRKLRQSASDKQTMTGGGYKQCAAIALLLSVCPRCHVTEVLNAIKALLRGSALCLCVYVCSGRGSPVTGYIGHAQTKLNTQQEPQAIRACHSA